MKILKLCADGASWCVIVSTILGWLPYAAALVAIIWNSIQIYTWWKNRKIS